MATSCIILESNPDFLQKLRVDKLCGIQDIFSLDPDDAGFVLKPCLAVLLRFPITKNYLDFMQPNVVSSRTLENVFFLKQMVPNACGTVALIHAIANNTQSLNLEENSIIGSFINLTKDLSPED